MEAEDGGTCTSASPPPLSPWCKGREGEGRSTTRALCTGQPWLLSGLQQQARRRTLSRKREVVLLVLIVIHLLRTFAPCSTSPPWQSAAAPHTLPSSLPLLPLYFVAATQYSSTLSFALTAFDTAMCPTGAASLTSSARQSAANACPYYDLYYILTTNLSTTTSVATTAASSPTSHKAAVQGDSPTTAATKQRGAARSTDARSDIQERQKRMLLSAAGAAAADTTAASTAASSSSSTSFSSVFKGPRSSLTAYYQVLNTDQFFYMLTGCTIVISVDSNLVPSYAYSSFQKYVKGYQLAALVPSPFSNSVATTTTTTATPTPAALSTSSTENKKGDAAGMRSNAVRVSNVSAAASNARAAAAAAAVSAASTGIAGEVYPGISLSQTFFYWNQPRLHCLLNAPALMAMRAQQQQQQSSNAVTAEDRAQFHQRRRTAAGNTSVGAAVVTATPSASSSSFASCASFLPDPAELAPAADVSTLLTANYLQLSANIMVKIFSYDVWYQLAHQAPTATGPKLSDDFRGANYRVKAEQQRTYTAEFSSVPPVWRTAAKSTSSTTTSDSSLNGVFADREAAHDGIGHNLIADPERVCSAPALYTISLNALLAGPSSWGLGTSGDWIQTNVSLTHRYPAARAVAVVAQCSGVPLSFSVTATFTNSKNRPGSGHNYYTSIIYFLFLVCYAFLLVVFLILIVPCGKQRRRERELKQKDTEKVQEEQADEKKSSRVHHEHRSRLHRHQRQQHTTGSMTAGDKEEMASTHSSSSSSSSNSRGASRHRRKKGSPQSSKASEAARTRAAAKHRVRTDAGDEPVASDAAKGQRSDGKKQLSAAGTNEADMPSLHSLHSDTSFSSSTDTTSSSPSSSVDSDDEHAQDVAVRRREARRSRRDGSAGNQKQSPPQRSRHTKRHGGSGAARTRRSASPDEPLFDATETSNSSTGSGTDSDDDTVSSGSDIAVYSELQSSHRHGSLRGGGGGRRRRRRRASSRSSNRTSSSNSDNNTATDHGSRVHHRQSSSVKARRQRTRSSRRQRTQGRSHASSATSVGTSTRSGGERIGLYTLLCCWASTAHSAENSSHDDDHNSSASHDDGWHARHRPSLMRRCVTTLVQFGNAVQKGVTQKIVAPMERWWKETYVIIIYAPLQWLLLVLIIIKVLLCILYSVKYSLMSKTTAENINTAFSLYVVCTIFSVAADSLIIPVEMLVGMGWGLAFTSPLPANQIVIVCLATIGVFVEYVFQATCDSGGYNLALTVNAFAKAANSGRCNAVAYARIGVELACRLHNVVRMFLLTMWLSHSVIPADAAAVQRQRRLRERQLRRYHHQQLQGGGSGSKGEDLDVGTKNSGSRSSSSSFTSSSPAQSTASAGRRRSNGLTSNPPPLPPPPITLSPPPRLGYPGTSLSAMDVYLRYQCMWAPFGMLLVWYILQVTFAFTFFEPEDYYMVVAFREFQTFYLFAFIVVFLRTSSPEYT